MHDAKTMKEYKAELGQALGNEFLRKTLNNFAVAYRAGRANAFAGMDVDALVKEIAAQKDDAIGRLDELYAQFKEKAEAAGAVVHLAKNAGEANALIAKIAAENGAKTFIKSKSMTAEETLLNHHLEHEGFEVTESDLGEWIIQLRHEGPSHMVMPAIHLSRNQVADLFSDVTGKRQEPDIDGLVKVARRELRGKFVGADVGVSGANFAIAETGTIGIMTNEGNARMTTTLPSVHVALVGLDKLVPSLKEALTVLRALPRNATGQAITTYGTWITGAVPCETGEEGKKKLHIVFLDNGRRALADDPEFAQVLRCVRCGACANVCPVYRLVGGHNYGHIYIGAIGFILTYFLHSRDKAEHLVQNCLNCGACKKVCAAGIDLPRLIKEIYARISEEKGHSGSNVLMGKLLSDRKLFHAALRVASMAQGPVKAEKGFIRHLPLIFSKEHKFRKLPALAKTPFRDMWAKAKPKTANPQYKVALFSGCVQDFVYPEQVMAGAKLLASRGADLNFPMGQSCCGLPALMLGEKKAARDVARQNIQAIDPASCDYIVTMCASCASHLKHEYPRLLADDPEMALTAERFADKVIDFSSLLHDVLGVEAKTDGAGAGQAVAYHAPCHLCRGLGVTKAPRELLAESGLDYRPYDEEEVCCGFGGSYSMKFPGLSAQMVGKKIKAAEETGAELLVTDCPGCVLQLRGGAAQMGSKLVVRHIAEVLAERLDCK